MPSLMLRNVPADLVAALKQRAQERGESKDATAIAMLRAGLVATSPESEQVCRSDRGNRGGEGAVTARLEQQGVGGEFLR